MNTLRWFFLLLPLFYAGSAMAAEQADLTVNAHGPSDGSIPAWNINTLAPKGWTKDCCTYAHAIGVSYVLYQGEWTGKPDRVMVLNVWPSKLPTLNAELQGDCQHYLQVDPAGKVSSFAIDNRQVPCRGVLYSGNDHIDDVVVFCDPGKVSGIRYSWSMTLAAADPERESLLKAFKQVIEHSSYVKGVSISSSTDKAK